MTRLTKTIKTDIKSVIREKAIKPKELALEAKKREFLLKAFWSQISKADYQAWKMLPKSMYDTVTATAYDLQIYDKTLGRIRTLYDKSLIHPRSINSWMSYENMPKHIQQEFKELIRCNIKRDLAESR